jgi:hypothetical protein
MVMRVVELRCDDGDHKYGVALTDKEAQALRGLVARFYGKRGEFTNSLYHTLREAGVERVYYRVRYAGIYRTGLELVEPEDD